MAEEKKTSWWKTALKVGGIAGVVAFLGVGLLVAIGGVGTFGAVVAGAIAFGLVAGIGGFTIGFAVGAIGSGIAKVFGEELSTLWEKTKGKLLNFAENHNIEWLKEWCETKPEEKKKEAEEEKSPGRWERFKNWLSPSKESSDDKAKASTSTTDLHNIATRKEEEGKPGFLKKIWNALFRANDTKKDESNQIYYDGSKVNFLGLNRIGDGNRRTSITSIPDEENNLNQKGLTQQQKNLGSR